jgi:hypothetical protein
MGWRSPGLKDLDYSVILHDNPRLNGIAKPLRSLGIGMYIYNSYNYYTYRLSLSLSLSLSLPIRERVDTYIKREVMNY